MIVINKLSKRRAISPVIATVILVAVAITVAVAVSYWMSSIAGQYTGFEKVEIQSGYASKLDAVDPAVYTPADEILDPLHIAGQPIPGTGSAAGWRITIKLKNTGSAPSTITSCFINEKPMEEYSVGSITWQYLDETGAPATITEDGVTLESGTSKTIYVNIIKNPDITFTSGTTINVKLHSAGGMDYIRLIQLS